MKYQHNIKNMYNGKIFMMIYDYTVGVGKLKKKKNRIIHTSHSTFIHIIAIKKKKNHTI